MPWPKIFDRETVRGDIEESSGRGLSVDDALPDSLIATAQRLGLLPAELRMWIYDEPKRGDWSTAALTSWAVRYGIRNHIEQAPRPQSGDEAPAEQETEPEKENLEP